MQGSEWNQANPELKQLVTEASEALARLDGSRLEELALSCQALNRSLMTSDGETQEQWARQTREAGSGLAIFARVLEATRANINVMNRLRALRARPLEYSERQIRGENAEAERGND